MEFTVSSQIMYTVFTVYSLQYSILIYSINKWNTHVIKLEAKRGIPILKLLIVPVL